MKALIFSVKHYAVHDGPGIRTTVFFKACPLTCWWCHNPESQFAKTEQILKKYVVGGEKITETSDVGRVIDTEELMFEILKDRLFYEESGGGVTFSGGEPLYQIDFLVEILKKCKEEELNTCIDTSGFASAKSIKRVIPYTDLFLFDIKHMNDAEHIRFTGVSNKPIFRNLEILIEAGANIVIRYPLIPGINDSQRNLSEMMNFFEKHRELKKIDILPYHNIASHKYEDLNKINRMKYVQEPDAEYVEFVKKLFRKIVPDVKIGG